VFTYVIQESGQIDTLWFTLIHRWSKKSNIYVLEVIKLRGTWQHMHVNNAMMLPLGHHARNKIPFIWTCEACMEKLFLFVL
jgi:hypothetical protein